MTTFSATTAVSELLKYNEQHTTNPKLLKPEAEALLKMIIDYNNRPFSTQSDVKMFLAKTLRADCTGIKLYEQKRTAAKRKMEALSSNIRVCTSLEALDSLSCAFFNELVLLFQDPSGHDSSQLPRHRNIFANYRATDFAMRHELYISDGEIFADKVALSRCHILMTIILWMHEVKGGDQDCWAEVHHTIKRSNYFAHLIDEKDSGVLLFMSPYIKVLVYVSLYGGKVDKESLFGALAMLFRNNHKDLRMSLGGAAGTRMSEVEDLYKRLTKGKHAAILLQANPSSVDHDLDGRCEELANILLGMTDEDLFDIDPPPTMLATL